MITIVAAAGENNELGKDKTLVWHLPDDFKRFKRLTSGHYIIMGRKTFESLGQALPNRTHIIITRQKDYAPENCIVVDSFEKAVEMCPKDEECFNIGGGEVFKIGLPYTDKIELTRVHGSFEADTFFPEFNTNEWNLVSQEFHPKDEKHNYDFTYETYLRKS